MLHTTFTLKHCPGKERFLSFPFHIEREKEEKVRQKEARFLDKVRRRGFCHFFHTQKTGNSSLEISPSVQLKGIPGLSEIVNHGCKHSRWGFSSSSSSSFWLFPPGPRYTKWRDRYILHTHTDGQTTWPRACVFQKEEEKDKKQPHSVGWTKRGSP